MAPRLPLDAIAVLLDRLPFALIVDFDGTISPIASAPEAARVDERCYRALQRIVGRVGVLAVISGRPVADVHRLVGLERVLYVGNHGMERWEAGEAIPVPGADSFRPRIAEALALLRERLHLPCLLLEDKGLVVGIHYRLCPDQESVRAEVLEVARAVATAAGLVVSEGKRVVELRPPLGQDKGTAVADLVRRYRLGSVLYVGDDRTDVAAFREIRDLRRAGDCEGISIGVRSTETPTAVVRWSDGTVDGVPGVAELLEWLDRKLELKSC